MGTIGLWLESLWIGAVYHYPWPVSMWGEPWRWRCRLRC
ncbi:hypothetical protein I552_0007 [Mycobacterium xenopi 3993]|nr:hypothetical protein I552_0007 [Mycobacterium xenopi 3993]